MDWKTLIADLQRAGLSQVQIAQFCGCVQSTISALARGAASGTDYEIGTALVQLHKKHARKPKPTTQEA